MDDLKDENEQYRKMVMESIEKIMGGLGAADVDSRLEEQLIDGILYAFQEQVSRIVTLILFESKCFLEHHFFKFVLIKIIFTDNRGRGDVEWFRGDSQRPWETRETLPSPDLWYNPLQAKQQSRQSSTTGG